MCEGILFLVLTHPQGAYSAGPDTEPIVNASNSHTLYFGKKSEKKKYTTDLYLTSIKIDCHNRAFAETFPRTAIVQS